MDEIRLKQICESALDTSYDGIIISEFRALPTHSFDEEVGEWIPHSYSFFIVLKKPTDHITTNREVENFLEGLLGFECCVDFV